MKRIWLATIVVAIVGAWTFGGGGKQDFVLINETALTITELYVSPADDDEWGEDVLGKDVLADGEEVEISFSRKEEDCVWDLKIVDEDDDSVVWENIDLCKARRITLYYRGKRPTADIE